MQNLQKVGGKRLVDRIHIIGDGGNDIARLVAVKVADRQRGQVFEHVMAHLLGNGARQADHDGVEQEGQAGGSGVENGHEDDAAVDNAEIHLACAQINGVDGRAGELGAVEGEHAAAEGEDDRQNQQTAVAAKVLPQAFEQRGFVQLLMAEAAVIALHGADFGARHAAAANQVAHQTASFPSPICVWAMMRYSSQVSMSSSWVPAPVTQPSSSTRIRSAWRRELTRCATSRVVVLR